MALFFDYCSRSISSGILRTSNSFIKKYNAQRFPSHLQVYKKNTPVSARRFLLFPPSPDILYHCYVHFSFDTFFSLEKADPFYKNTIVEEKRSRVVVRTRPEKLGGQTQVKKPGAGAAWELSTQRPPLRHGLELQWAPISPAPLAIVWLSRRATSLCCLYVPSAAQSGRIVT